MPEAIPTDLLDLRGRLARFLREDLVDLAQAEADDVPRDVQQEVRERSQAAGFLALTQPKAVGGGEAGPLARTVLYETLAAVNSPLARFVLGPGPGLLARAEGPLRDRYLQPVVRGELRGAFAFTEPGGPDAPLRPTWAVRDGTVLVITGQKSYVSGGATADFYTILVNVEPGEAGPGGTAMVIIDRETPGVIIDRRFTSLDGGHHVSIRLDNVRVPATNVIGKIGQGMPAALRGITEERLEIAASACGIALWTVDYVTTHITAPHPSGNRLGDREGVRLRYSDMRIETYAARAMLYRTARLAEAGNDPMNEAMATKVFCAEATGRVVDTAVQLVGGQALVSGHPLEALYRRVRSFRLAGGATDVLRLNIARGRIDFDAGTL